MPASIATNVARRDRPSRSIQGWRYSSPASARPRQRARARRGRVELAPARERPGRRAPRRRSASRAARVERDVLLARDAPRRRGSPAASRAWWSRSTSDGRGASGDARARGADQGELDVDRRRSLRPRTRPRPGQRRLAVHAPVHRLEALVDEPAADEASELAHDDRLVGGRHRQVRDAPSRRRRRAAGTPRAGCRRTSARTRGSAGASRRDPSRGARRRPAGRGRAPCRPDARSAARGSPSPGRRRALWPAIVRDFTTMSLRTLLSAWPMWMCPFA